MSRSEHFNTIEEQLSILAVRIKTRGALNILDLHIHSENFYLHFLNLVFGWQLESLNAVNQNAPGIDLIDKTNQIVVQVSATATKHKIESALDKVPKGFHGYSFKFVPIVSDASNLRSNQISNPHRMRFNPTEDILDIEQILRLVLSFDIDKQIELSGFLSKELRWGPDPGRVETNLAELINILAQEDWSRTDLTTDSIPFDINQKIDYNDLQNSREVVEDFRGYYSRLAKIYTEHAKLGINKNLSVTLKIRSIFQKTSPSLSPDDQFSAVIRETIDLIKASRNYRAIPEEELEMCVQILTVDAFIRCKIFKKPPQV